MFKVKNNTFFVTRGDQGSFTVSFSDYTFAAGDELEFYIYNEDGLDSYCLLKKTKTVSSAAESATIDLLAADTDIGTPGNEVQTYWYEIKLNGAQTPLCYDENGPKLFYLYPSGIGEYQQIQS